MKSFERSFILMVVAFLVAVTLIRIFGCDCP